MSQPYLLPLLAVSAVAVLVGCSGGPAASGGAAAPAGGTTTPAAVSFKADVQPWLQANCASCHKPGGRGRGAFFKADGTPDLAVIKADSGAMIAAIAAKRMPPNNPSAVSAAQLQALRDWVAAGTPDN